MTLFTGTRREQRSQLVDRRHGLPYGVAASLHQRCNPSRTPNYQRLNAFPAAWKIDGRGHALVRRITQMPLRPLLVGIWDVRNGSEADAAGSDDHVR